MTNNEAKEAGLPYFDERGFIYNTYHFSDVANKKLKTGRYTDFPEMSKPWIEFWHGERDKCLHGITLGTVRVTGYHYFYLNYYTMDVPVEVSPGVFDKERRFPKFWLADWQFFRVIEYCEENGLHFGAVKVRGCGYSEKCAAMGARDTNICGVDTNGNTVFRKTFYFGSEDGHLGGDGIVHKCFKAIDYLNAETEKAFRKNFQLADKPADYYREAGIIETTYDKFGKKHSIRKQTGGLVKGVLIDNPDKVRGNRGFKLYFEEAGAAPKLIPALNVARPLVEQQGKVLGRILVWGTSNYKGASVEGLKQIIYNPQGFRMVKFRNIWTAPSEGFTEDFFNKLPNDPLDFVIPYDTEEYYEKGSGVGWFVPSYDIGEFDEHGNPLRWKNYKNILKERQATLSGQSEEQALTVFADKPITIVEALSNTHGREFTSPKLARQVVDLETGIIKPEIETGFMFIKKNKDGIPISVVFEPNPKGKIKILSHPSWAKLDVFGNYVVDLQDTDAMKVKLHIAGIDSIDQALADSEGSEDKTSKLACVIKRRIDPDNPMSDYNSSYVALYVNRPEYVTTAYNDVAALLMYYNAIGLVEYTKIHIVKHFQQYKYLRYLAKEPASPSSSIASYKPNPNKYGIRSTKEIVNYYILKIKDYLEDYADKIYFKEQLSQLVDYTREDKTKFDIIAAMGHCEILDFEYHAVLPSNSRKNVAQYKMGWVIDPSGKRVFKELTPKPEFDRTDAPQYYDSELKKFVYYD